MKFVYIEPGSFMMGSLSSESGRDNDERQHRVTLSKGYYMQTTEVTQGQWYDVMGTKPWSGKTYAREGRNHAASYVSWNDAREFIRKLNAKEGTNKYRLPMEAQWEYACRAGSDAAYGFGNSNSDLGSYAWYDENAWDIGDKYAHGVGQKKPNSWGLYDMHGNVWEWCQDWYGNYPSGSVTNPQGASSGSKRVLRGGSFYDVARDCRSAVRDGVGSGGRTGINGFRLAFFPVQCALSAGSAILLGYPHRSTRNGPERGTSGRGMELCGDRIANTMARVKRMTRAFFVCQSLRKTS